MTPVVPEALYTGPNALAQHYSRFRVADRLLLTGHSHQAWPDCGFAAQQQAWKDAAELVDEKWERAFAKADRVRRGWAQLLGDAPDRIALGVSTHDLVVRFLSALPLQRRPRLITTDGEFHTIRRQLDRLAEEGVEVVKVPSEPASDISTKLQAAVDDRTAAVMVSAVLFQNAHIVPGLGAVLDACQLVGAELLVDAYHALDAIEFRLDTEKLEAAFVVGGGYKYCQLGEGNCFLRFPEQCALRPVVTGWFSEFSALAQPETAGVAYGDGPDRFAGATYDPTSHYRAAAVFDFFEEQRLTPPLLREVSRHQVGLLAEAVDALDVPPDLISRDRRTPLERIGGFLALRTPKAAEVSGALRDHGVLTDYRGDILRLGPAPYLNDEQLGEAVDALGIVVRTLE